MVLAATDQPTARGLAH